MRCWSSAVHILQCTTSEYVLCLLQILKIHVSEQHLLYLLQPGLGTFHVYLHFLCLFCSVIIRWTELCSDSWIKTEVKQTQKSVSVHKGYFNGKFSSILKYWDPFHSWIILRNITNGKSPLWMGGCYWRKRQRKGKHSFCCVWHFMGQDMF